MKWGTWDKFRIIVNIWIIQSVTQTFYSNDDLLIFITVKKYIQIHNLPYNVFQIKFLPIQIHNFVGKQSKLIVQFTKIMLDTRYKISKQ